MNTVLFEQLSGCPESTENPEFLKGEFHEMGYKENVLNGFMGLFPTKLLFFWTN
jgi:hypothetical protein